MNLNSNFEIPVTHEYPDGSATELAVVKYASDDFISIGGDAGFVILASEKHIDDLIVALQKAKKLTYGGDHNNLIVVSSMISS